MSSSSDLQQQQHQSVPNPTIIIDDGSSSPSLASSSPSSTKATQREIETTMKPRKPEIHFQTAKTNPSPSSELEKLLVDQIAACHLKDDEILSLEQTVANMKKENERETHSNQKLRHELSKVEDALCSERKTRQDAQAMLVDAKFQTAPLLDDYNKTVSEMSYFAEVKGIAKEGKVCEQVTSLIGAFMALQLELIRTVKWSFNSFFEMQNDIFQSTIVEAEQLEFRGIFLEFEIAQRRIDIERGEEISRENEIEDEKTRFELRILSSSVMLNDHSKLFGKISFEYCNKAQSEWVSTTSTFIEHQRRTAATKLRQVNAKLKKAQEDSEEKSRQIDEAKKNYSLLKANFDVRTKEQASARQNQQHETSITMKKKPELDTGLAASAKKKRPSSSSIAATGQRKQQVICSGNNNNNTDSDTKARPSTPPPNSSSSATARNLESKFNQYSTSSFADDTNTTTTTPPPSATAASGNKENTTSKKPARVFDFTPRPLPPSEQTQATHHHQQEGSTTPPPAFLQHQQQQQTTNINYSNNNVNQQSSSSRRNSTSSITHLVQTHQSASGAQTPTYQSLNPLDSSSSAMKPAQAAASLYNDLVSMVETLEHDHTQKDFVAKITQDLSHLRQHLNLLEEAIIRKDERLNRVLEERNSLNRECDTIASQCRLLEQACRFGAKKAAEQNAQIILSKM